MELVLSAVYDCTFMSTSHGFRPGKSRHTALKVITQKSKNVAWWIQADITKCFDSMPHDPLLSIVSKKIRCRKTLALIHSSLRAGHMCMDVIRTRNLMAQHNVLSPLLCNIYMHELDLFMHRLICDFHSGKGRKVAAVYSAVAKKLSSSQSIEEKLNWHKPIRRLSSGDPMYKNLRHVSYVRYADDFLIGVTGSHKEAVVIMNQVSVFLRNYLGLDLNQSKIKLIDACKSKAYFLDTYLSCNSNLHKKLPKSFRSEFRNKVRVQSVVQLNAPIDQLVRKLATRKFFKWVRGNNSVWPTGLKPMINRDHADIVKYYNKVVHGLLNYYCFRHNKSGLNSIVHYLRYSCRLTLAKKFKLRTIAAAFKKFGS